MVDTAIHTFDKNYFCGAPTRRQAKQIFWRDLKELTPAPFISEINNTDLIIRNTSGSMLQVLGLEAFQRVEGQPWHGCVVSEAQEVAATFFDSSLPPILADTGGFAIIEGRPGIGGRNKFYDLAERAKDTEGWGFYTWSSEDVLSAKQIIQLKRSLGEQDYQREVNASFDCGGQNAYYAFSRKNVRPLKLNTSLPVCVTCDFNATEKPMTWSVLQFHGEEIFVLRTVARKYTVTEQMCEVLWEEFHKLGHVPRELTFYGDYSGVRITSNSSLSDWEIIKRWFGHKSVAVKTKYKPCKSVRGRVAATNAKLSNASGERTLFVNAKGCEALIRDFERVQWKDNNIELDQTTDVTLTHAGDGIDYFTDYEFPILGKPQTRVYN